MPVFHSASPPVNNAPKEEKSLAPCLWGKGFFGFKDIEQALNIKVYFADAHAPWQRGSNENVNGLLRFFFPRGTDFTKVTDEQLDAVLELINNRPRKCLDYLSPIEFINKVLHLA